MKKLIVAAAIAAGALVFSSSAIADTDSERFLSVTGVGVVDVYPDSARFTGSVIQAAALADDAGGKVKSTISDFVAAAKKLGIEEERIESTGPKATAFFVSKGDGVASRQKGYQVAQEITVSGLDPKKGEDLVQIANELGFAQIKPLFLYTERLDKLRQETLRAAVEDALSSAKAIAEAGGFELGKVLRVEVIDSDSGPTQDDHRPANARFVGGEARSESAVLLRVEITDIEQEKSAPELISL